MKTRGQITIFIIIGLVLLLLAGLYYAVSNILVSSQLESTEKQALDFNQKAENVNFYATQCVKNAAISSLYFFGYSGSTLKSDIAPLKSNNVIPISYLRVNDKKYLEPITGWESTVSGLMDVALEICDFSTFEEQGLMIEKSKPSTSVNINENNVIFNVKYPIKITQSKNIKEYSDYQINVPIRLGYIYKLVNDIIDKEIAVEGMIPVSTILKYNLNVTTIDYENENTIVYTIIDPLKISTYKFLFADKEGD